MTKEELEKIANISDLRKYKTCAEYERILEQCKIAEENSREKVRGMYNNKEEKKYDWDFHDKTYMWIEFLRGKLNDIKSTSKGAEALRKELEGDIMYNDNMMTGHVMDKYNNVFSAVVLNNYDIARLKGTNNRLFPQILDGLINTLEKREKKVEEVY